MEHHTSFPIFREQDSLGEMQWSTDITLEQECFKIVVGTIRILVNIDKDTKSWEVLECARLRVRNNNDNYNM